MTAGTSNGAEQHSALLRPGDGSPYETRTGKAWKGELHSVPDAPRKPWRVPAEGGVRGELPSRLPSTQAEPSRRGPWRPGRSYSGALHLDARNHARSTDVRADGRRDGSGEGWWQE